MSKLITTVAAISLSLTAATAAQDFQSTINAEFVFNGKHIKITRDSAQAAPLVRRFADSAGACKNGCLAPARAAPGVPTLGEREVLDFLLGEVSGNTGLLVDARMPDTRSLGHIPGSVSLPYQTMEAENGYRNDILEALGAQSSATGFDFDAARSLLIYDAGPTQRDAAMLVTYLLAAGYPADKISYYRGGMLMWAALGLSIEQESGS